MQREKIDTLLNEAIKEIKELIHSYYTQEEDKPYLESTIQMIESARIELRVDINELKSFIESFLEKETDKALSFEINRSPTDNTFVVSIYNKTMDLEELFDLARELNREWSNLNYVPQDQSVVIIASMK